MSGPSSASARRPMWAAFASIVAVIVVVDQVTKAWVVSAVPAGGSLSLVGDSVRLIIVHNTGAIFGLFRDQAEVFAIASIVVLMLIGVYHARSGRSPLMTLTLGLLFGGAVGNFIDRIRLGYVVDFVDMGFGDVRFYTFNVADAAVSGAILLLILLAIRPDLGPSSPDPAPPDPAPPDPAPPDPAPPDPSPVADDA